MCRLLRILLLEIHYDYTKTNSTDFVMRVHSQYRTHRRQYSASPSFRVVITIFLSVLLLPSTMYIKAQQPSFKCTRLTTDDGLSDNMVFCALQDRYGFMWFGTRDGLNRYDGQKFTVYRHIAQDSSSLSDNSISCLYEDSKGNLWIGTQQGGLNKFDRTTSSFVRYTHDSLKTSTINRGQVAVICEDSLGYLWVTTAYPNPSLQRFNPRKGTFRRYFHNASDRYSISSNLISGICRDSTGALWIGTFNQGINQYDFEYDRFINKHTFPGYGEKFTGKYIISLRTASAGNFWVTDTTYSIHQLTVKEHVSQRVSFRPREFTISEVGSVRGFVQDQHQYLWVGIDDAGLYVIAPNLTDYYHYRSTYASAPYGLSSRIRTIVIDRDYNIWIGTDRGINFFHHQTRFFKHGFDHYPDPQQTEPSEIRSIWKDGNTLWLGTAGKGIYCLSYPYYKNYKLFNASNATALYSNTVNIIYPQYNGKTVLIGTNEGIYKQSRRGTFHYLPLRINGWRIWSILQDKNANLWVGALHEGLSQLNHKTGSAHTYFHDYPIPGTLWGATDVFALHEETHHDLLWIGTNQGLYCYNQRTKQFNHYAHRDGDPTTLSHNHVWYIHQTKDGKLWLGTSGGGLNAFDPKTGKFRHFLEKDGLPSNIICGILEDDHGNLWISTNRGLSKFTPSTGQFRNFGIGEGLFISEFHFKTCFKEDNGTMYFGGVGGYVAFHPDSIAINTTPPLLAITSFKVFDKELHLDTAITYKKEVVLEHNDNFFSIEFAAMDFANPVRNQYRYKLLNYDEQWRSTTGERPYASYTTVPPGTYTFLLQAANSDGVWNKTGIRLSIVVLPAWWQTLWFRTALGAFLLLMLVALGYWRYKHVQHRNQMARRLVESQLQALRSQMNPHFIFNSLNSILHFITTNDADTAHSFLSKFSKLIRATLEHSRNEFILLAEEVQILSIYLELEAMRFDHQFAYELVVDPSIDVYAQQIPPLLIQPYVENAIKHGLIHTVENGKISVIIRREEQHILCSVIDNGIGRQRAQEIKQQSAHRYVSRGISITKDRLDILNSIHSERYDVEIKDLADSSGSSRGTRVDIRISPKDSVNAKLVSEHEN